ncbi:SIR2 family protein [Metabacillus halosaccharovorans]|uniref:SIR2 family protein n=1 Tax=Metabacillus halosaccharovorans TaxID=930124 RepID=UPI00403D9C9F
MSVNIEKLRKDYHAGKVVPFIGAGLSIPFKVPNWGDLIRNIAAKYSIGRYVFIKDAIEVDLERNDFWSAISALKNYASIIDEDIQNEIVDLIKERQIKLEDDTLHNYSDLAKMDFKLYLTTNYENILQDYLKCEIPPILLKDIQFSTQRLFDEKRICHLHGFTANSGTIVISRESYNELYENKKYENLLKLVTGGRSLLFMGFSFDDQFISTLIKDHRELFISSHYILLDNPSTEKIKRLRQEYGLITIPYETEGSTHVAEIRKVLEQIAEPKVENKSGNSSVPDVKSIGSNNSIVLGAGISDIRKDLKGNLFYKKLKLENISESMIELSSIFYVASEKYIRALKQAGMSLDVIEAILFEVFTKYKERYVDTYEVYGDSRQLLKVVHESLSEFDFGRYSVFFEDSKSNESENKGLIHLLADDDTMDIWWGEVRFDELAD